MNIRDLREHSQHIMAHIFIMTPVNLGVTWVTRERVAQTEAGAFISMLKDLCDSNPALELGSAIFYFIKGPKMINQLSLGIREGVKRSCFCFPFIHSSIHPLFL